MYQCTSTYYMLLEVLGAVSLTLIDKRDCEYLVLEKQQNILFPSHKGMQLFCTVAAFLKWFCVTMLNYASKVKIYAMFL